MAEREMPADVDTWPIVFTEADSDLNALYATLEKNSLQIEEYLTAAGIPAAEVTRSRSDCASSVKRVVVFFSLTISCRFSSAMINVATLPATKTPRNNATQIHGLS